jgi:hypothetical protein
MSKILNLFLDRGVIQCKLPFISEDKVHDGLEILDHPLTVSSPFLNDTPLIDVGDGESDEQDGCKHEKGDIKDDLCSEAQINFSK